MTVDGMSIPTAVATELDLSTRPDQIPYHTFAEIEIHQIRPSSAADTVNNRAKRAEMRTQPDVRAMPYTSTG
jgi:hypothetical protein